MKPEIDQKQRSLLLDIHRRLLRAYGPQGWWPGESAFEVIVGAILTQAASWKNVEKALASLKGAGVFSPEGLRRVSLEELATLVRSVGYFNSKARKLKSFMEHLGRRYRDDLGLMFTRDPSELRQELLSIYGIGEETADAILLYAGQLPFFVVDAYTRRIFARLGCVPQEHQYKHWQHLFLANLPTDISLFNEYHALLVCHGKERCRRDPLCHGCTVAELCATGKTKLWPTRLQGLATGEAGVGLMPVADVGLFQ